MSNRIFPAASSVAIPHNLRAKRKAKPSSGDNRRTVPLTSGLSPTSRGKKTLAKCHRAQYVDSTSIHNHAWPFSSHIRYLPKDLN